MEDKKDLLNSLNQKQLLTILIGEVQEVKDRVVKLEEAMNMGRGAFKAFLVLLTVVGTAASAIKLFWK